MTLHSFLIFSAFSFTLLSCQKPFRANGSDDGGSVLLSIPELKQDETSYFTHLVLKSIASNCKGIASPTPQTQTIALGSQKSLSVTVNNNCDHTIYISMGQLNNDTLVDYATGSNSLSSTELKSANGAVNLSIKLSLTAKGRNIPLLMERFGSGSNISDLNRIEPTLTGSLTSVLNQQELIVATATRRHQIKVESSSRILSATGQELSLNASELIGRNVKVYGSITDHYISARTILFK